MDDPTEWTAVDKAIADSDFSAAENAHAIYVLAKKLGLDDTSDAAWREAKDKICDELEENGLTLEDIDEGDLVQEVLDGFTTTHETAQYVLKNALLKEG